MFTAARIKLTFWYVAIIMLLTSIISLAFYTRTSTMLELEFARIESRLQREWLGRNHAPLPHNGRRLLPEDIDTAKSQMISHLITINSLVALITAIAGYALSGITLQPIQKAHEDQKRFVADAAHELKTPITAIKASLEANLLDKKISKQTRDILGENLQDIISLEVLSQNLLQLARIENVDFEKERESLNKIIKRSLKRIGKLATEKNINIIVSDPKKLMVLGDAESLVSMFTILLDNAIKYSPKNSQIKVTIRKEGSKYAVTEVIDQGQGINPSDYPHIFKRFYRADSARSKKNSDGFGLGLSVAKAIVDDHKGNISVRSSLGNGSTFSVRIPLA